MVRVGQDCPREHKDAVGWSGEDPIGGIVGRADVGDDSTEYHCLGGLWRYHVFIQYGREGNISCVKEGEIWLSHMTLASIPTNESIKVRVATQRRQQVLLQNDCWLIEWIKAKVNQQIHVIPWLKQGIVTIDFGIGMNQSTKPIQIKSTETHT